METKKIRIGNDIRLAVDLKQYIGGRYLLERDVYTPGYSEFENIDTNPFVNKDYELYYPGDLLNPNNHHYDYTPTSTPICIRSVKAILVNATRQKEKAEDLRKKSRFIHRFPIEPMFEAFRATPYDVCCSGYPTWRAYPMYRGFGLNPHFDGLRKPFPVNDTEYHAPVAATSLQNIVEVMFPAEDQLHVGTYNLIIVAKIYAPGFNKNNLKTITLDVPNVFELVKTTEEGVDTAFDITVTRTLDRLPGPSGSFTRDIYVDSGMSDPDNNSLLLNRTDNSVVDIDLNNIIGWYDED